MWYDILGPLVGSPLLNTECFVQLFTVVEAEFINCGRMSSRRCLRILVPVALWVFSHQGWGVCISSLILRGC
jgi:hypothetical protein